MNGLRGLNESGEGSSRVLPPGVVNVFATDTGVIAVADEDWRFWTGVDVERVDAVVGSGGKLASLSLVIFGEVYELRAMFGRIDIRRDNGQDR